MSQTSWRSRVGTHRNSAGFDNGMKDGPQSHPGFRRRQLPYPPGSVASVGARTGWSGESGNPYSWASWDSKGSRVRASSAVGPMPFQDNITDHL